MLQLNPDSIYVAVKGTGDVKPVTFQQLLSGEAATDAEDQTTVPATKFIDVTQPHKRVPRPLNAFMLFANDQRGEYKKLFPFMENKDISIKLGNDWHQLSESEQHVYFNKAKALEIEHHQKYPDYQYVPATRSMRGRKRQRMSPNERAAMNSFKQRILSYSTDNIRQIAPRNDASQIVSHQQIWQRSSSYACFPPPPSRKARQLQYYPIPATVPIFSSRVLENQEPPPRTPGAQTRSRSLLKKSILKRPPASEEPKQKRPRGRPPKQPKDNSSKETLEAQSNLVSLLHEQDKSSNASHPNEEKANSSNQPKPAKPMERVASSSSSSRLVSIIKKHQAAMKQRKDLPDGDNDLSDITTLLHHANKKPNIIGFPLQGERGSKMVHLIVPESEESEESSDDDSCIQDAVNMVNPANIPACSTQPQTLESHRNRRDSNCANTYPPGSMPRTMQVSPNKPMAYEYPHTYEILPRYCSPPRYRHSPTWGAYPKLQPYDQYAFNTTAAAPHNYHPWNMDYPSQQATPPPSGGYHGYPAPYPSGAEADLDSLQPSLCREDLQQLGDSSPMSLLAEACGLVYHRDCLDQQLPNSQESQNGVNPGLMEDESVFPHERAPSVDGSQAMERPFSEPGKDGPVGESGGPLYEPLYHRDMDVESAEGQVSDFCCLGVNGQHNVERLPSIDSFFASTPPVRPSSTEAADALSQEDQVQLPGVTMETADEDARSAAPSILEEAAKAANLVTHIKDSPSDISVGQEGPVTQSVGSLLQDTEDEEYLESSVDSGHGNSANEQDEDTADLHTEDSLKTNMATLQELVAEALEKAGLQSKLTYKLTARTVGMDANAPDDSPLAAKTERLDLEHVDLDTKTSTKSTDNMAAKSDSNTFSRLNDVPQSKQADQNTDETQDKVCNQTGIECENSGCGGGTCALEELVKGAPWGMDKLTCDKYQVIFMREDSPDREREDNNICSSTEHVEPNGDTDQQHFNSREQDDIGLALKPLAAS